MGWLALPVLGGHGGNVMAQLARVRRWTACSIISATSAATVVAWVSVALWGLWLVLLAWAEPSDLVPGVPLIVHLAAFTVVGWLVATAPGSGVIGWLLLAYVICSSVGGVSAAWATLAIVQAAKILRVTIISSISSQPP
jgi:hypothetical protein